MEGYTMAMAGNYGYFVIMIVIAVLADDAQQFWAEGCAHHPRGR